MLFLYFFLSWNSYKIFGFTSSSYMGFPVGSDGKEYTCNVRTWVQSLDWEDPLEEGMTIHSSILAWRTPMDRRAWWATVHGVAKTQTWLSDWAQHSIFTKGFPSDSVNPSASAGDSGSILELGRSPGGGNVNPLQYSCWGNPTDREA